VDADRIRCPVCHRPGTYCFDHNRCKYNMGTTYGPRPGPRFEYACPDIDQGADDSDMMFPEETPLPVQQAETFDAWMTRTGGRADPAPAYYADRAARKATPMARGLLDYFPKALAAVARCSLICNEQHNPGETMHWARDKSTDEADALIRHMIDRGKFDTDGQRHSTKVAWRALAMLERELDGETI
jgi:hypothetical protein